MPRRTALRYPNETYSFESASRALAEVSAWPLVDLVSDLDEPVLVDEDVGAL